MRTWTGSQCESNRDADEKQPIVSELTLPHPSSTPIPPASTNIPAPSATEELRNKLQQLYLAGGITAPAPLNEEDHNCRFWDKNKWKTWADAAKEQGLFRSRVRGAGKNSSWMEDENGNRVGLNTQKAILQEVHAAWVDMNEAEIKLTNYRDMPGIVMDYFHARLESKFPKLRLCEDHWKADQAWQENFSSSKFRVKGKGKPKTQKTAPENTGNGGASDTQGPPPGNSGNGGASDTQGPPPGNAGDDGTSDTQGPPPGNAGDDGVSDTERPPSGNAGNDGASDTQGPAPRNVGNDRPTEGAPVLPGDTHRTPETVRVFNDVVNSLP